MLLCCRMAESQQQAHLQALHALLQEWGADHKLQPCLDAHNTKCGCWMPLVKGEARLSCSIIFYCSADCKEGGGVVCSRGTPQCCTKCYRAPQCTVHGCNAQAGAPELLEAVASQGWPGCRSVLVEVPLKSVPQKGVSRKQRGASSGGQFRAGWVKVDVLLVQHGAAGNALAKVGMEVQGSSHAHSEKAASQDAAKAEAAKAVGLQLLQVQAETFATKPLEVLVPRSKRSRLAKDFRGPEQDVQLQLIQQALRC